MPFTVSHAAAAAPLWRLSRGRLVVSALVAGAMAPDFEYLVHLSTRRTIGHTLPGLFVLCLPLSLAALWAWHRLVAPAWAPLAGRPAARFSFWPPSRLAAVAASILVGSLSHLAWDAFTHEGGLVVRHVGVLAGTVPGTGLPVYGLLQHASTVGGAVFLAFWAHRALGWDRPAVPAALLLASVAVGWATVAGAFVNGYVHGVAGGDTPVQILAAAAVGAMAAGTAAVLAASAALLWWRRPPPAPPTRRRLVIPAGR